MNRGCPCKLDRRHLTHRGWITLRALGCDSRRSDAGAVKELVADVRHNVSYVDNFAHLACLITLYESVSAETNERVLSDRVGCASRVGSLQVRSFSVDQDVEESTV